MEDADGGFGGAGVKKPPCCLGGKYREDLLDKKGNCYSRGGADVAMKKIRDCYFMSM